MVCSRAVILAWPDFNGLLTKTWDIEILATVDANHIGQGIEHLSVILDISAILNLIYQSVTYFINNEELTIS